ncbi:MAG: signal peptide peptidase SppA [Alphaproteobacteria bacterium]|nr:signal peptide peptidase SppA [Alphaproteobacteria bacterium]
MSLDADAIADRRRLKRGLVVWRLLALVILVAAIAGAMWSSDRITLGDRVAQIDVNGVILNDEERLITLRRIAGDSAIKALVVRIDSPGGTVVAGEELYRALSEVAAQKPVVTVIGGTGASAAYMIALAADRIVVRENSITGSIGVILQSFDISQMLGKLGIDPTLIKSAPLKDQPNPFEPITPAGRAAIQAVVDDTYRWFVDLVIQRRALSPTTALQISDGRVYTGRQAVALNLVDAVGGVDEARAWLADNKAVPLTLPLHRIEPDRALDMSGGIFGLVRKTLLSETLRIDGLVSLWQPEALR